MAYPTWTAAFRNKVRLLAGISSEELDDTNLDILADMSVDWFDVQTGLTYSLGSDAAYDQAIVYYTCYLGSIVESGMGISEIRLADVDVKYNNAEFANFVDLALELLAMKLGISIKKTTYNADPYLGRVNWDKNVTGVDSTLDFRKKPRGMNYNK
jgi:hypothetical protein